MGAWARRRPWQGATPFSGQSVCACRRVAVIVYDLALFFEVIAFAVISFLFGIFMKSFFLQQEWSLHWMSWWWLLGIHCDCIGSFNGSCGSCHDDGCGLSRGWEQQEDEPSSSSLAASSPWACQAHWLFCWQSGTAWNKSQAKEGLWVPFWSFLQTQSDAPLPAQKRFVCFSHAPWVTLSFIGGTHCWGSWRAALDAA